MALTNRKSIIYPPLENGERYIVARPKSQENDYRLHIKILFEFTAQLPKDNSLTNFKIPRHELVNLLAWQNDSIIELDALIERLIERKLYVVKSNGQDCYSFFSHLSYDESDFILTINPLIYPFLRWQLNYWGLSNYARIDFAATHLFSSVYSEIMYNKIITTSECEFTISVDDFRDMVWATAPSYSDIRNLKKKVIQPILKDINEFTQYQLSVGQVNLVRRATHLVFSWQINK